MKHLMNLNVKDFDQEIEKLKKDFVKKSQDTV